jgi:predicted amidophosphoribosyltransferase
MSDDYYCSRCGVAHAWARMTQTPEGALFCPACWRKVDPATAPVRKCPVDGAQLKVERLAEIVLVHLCPVCGGTWIDDEERQLIGKLSANEELRKQLFWLWMSVMK